MRTYEEMPVLESLAERLARENGLTLDDCPYKSKFYQWQWVLMIIGQRNAIRIPWAGEMTCPHCRETFRASLRVDEAIPD